MCRLNTAGPGLRAEGHQFHRAKAKPPRSSARQTSKSTLINLIPALRRYRGQILIDGIDIGICHSATAGDYRVCAAKAVLFSGTVNQSAVRQAGRVHDEIRLAPIPPKPPSSFKLCLMESTADSQGGACVSDGRNSGCPSLARAGEKRRRFISLTTAFPRWILRPTLR